ncbi:phosphoribosylformylglycinamidine synthase subunit PurS [soil metagenome]
MRFRAAIHVMLKKDVADVQGIAIQQSLARHGHAVSAVKAGKYFELEIEADNKLAATNILNALADGVFSNPVIEEFRCECEEANSSHKE